jgi:hypothetical protein
MKKLRVPIPATCSKEVLDLATKIMNKHFSDAEASKLSGLDWQQMRPIIEQAAQFQNEADHHRTLAMQRIQDRNLLMEEVLEIVRNSRDILTGSFKKDMKKLGNWGFTVVENIAGRRVADDSKLSARS